jgi:hypothetical protein
LHALRITEDRGAAGVSVTPSNGRLSPRRLKGEVIDLRGRDSQRAKLRGGQRPKFPNDDPVAVSLSPAADCGGHRLSPGQELASSNTTETIAYPFPACFCNPQNGFV